MNDLFKNEKKQRIELTEGFFLVPDGAYGLVLQREVEKIRVKKDKTEEKYLDVQQFYYPRTSQALTKYLNETLSDSKSLEDIKNSLERVEKTINLIKENW
jgi:hypothetical protein